MSDQSNQAPQSALTPEELRQRILDQLSTEQKVIEELSDEELDHVAGGAIIVDVTHEFESGSSHYSSAPGSPMHESAPGSTSGERFSAKSKVPQAYKASAAGLSTGASASFTVGLVAGKLSISG